MEHIQARDDTCVRPGCSTPAESCDIDHTIEYHHQPGTDPPLGTTSANNLGALCRRDHRIKTTGGFRLRQPEPGTFEWLTPTGHHYRFEPDPPEPEPEPTPRYPDDPPF